MSKAHVQQADNKPATRTHKIRQRLQEELRDKLKGGAYIRELEECAKSLRTLQAGATIQRRKRLTAKDRITITEVNLTIQTYDLEIKIIKERIALNLKRLRFILPALRSTEITDPDGGSPLAKLGATMAELTKEIAKG